MFNPFQNPRTATALAFLCLVGLSPGGCVSSPPTHGGQPRQDGRSLNQPDSLANAVAQFTLWWRNEWGSSAIASPLDSGMLPPPASSLLSNERVRQYQSANWSPVGSAGCQAKSWWTIEPSFIPGAKGRDFGPLWTVRIMDILTAGFSHGSFRVPGSVDEADDIDAYILPARLPVVRSYRASLIAFLDRHRQSRLGNAWLEGQLVRFLVDQKDFSRARIAASACAAERWWCDALRGYVEYQALAVARADSFFGASGFRVGRGGESGVEVQAPEME